MSKFRGKAVQVTGIVTLVSAVALLSACSGPDEKAQAPMPPAEVAAPDMMPSNPAPMVAGMEPLPPMSPVPPPVVETAMPTATDRLQALEAAVSELRADYGRMAPAFAGLIATNERLNILLAKLEAEEGVSSVPPMAAALPPVASVPPATPMFTDKKPDVKPVAATQAKSNAPGVSAVRIGEHTGKTRLVLDLDGAVPQWSIDLDNAEKILTLDLPGTNWKTADLGSITSSPLISSWAWQKKPDGGSILAVQLKSPAKVLSSGKMKADGKYPARLVLDLAQAS